MSRSSSPPGAPTPSRSGQATSLGSRSVSALPSDGQHQTPDCSRRKVTRVNDTVPAILPTQFESESIGKLSQSVNMFRGAVNVTKTLVNLPGKPGDTTLAVRLSMISDSAVSQQALQWNLDAPTGILGLGWTIARNRITAQTAGALSPYALSYSLEYSNTSSALIEDDLPWLRVTLDASVAATLAAGTVNTAVVEAFAAQSVAL